MNRMSHRSLTKVAPLSPSRRALLHDLGGIISFLVEPNGTSGTSPFLGFILSK